MEQIIEGYKKCLGIEAQDLVREVEKGKAIKAYSFAETNLRDFDYEVDDIEEFIFELYKGDGGRIPLEISGLTGIYLSALCNMSKDEKIELNLRPINQKIDFIGYRLPEGKTLILQGDVGNFVGAELQGGDLFVEGSAGDCAGAGMKEGRLFVSKKSGLNTGEWKSGGEIHVEGGIGSLGIHITGGHVYQAGQLKKYG